MKVVHLQAYGNPRDAVACVEVEDAPAPGAGEVRFSVDAFPINPADVLLTEGKYAAKPPVPALLGAECAGTVTDVGDGVDDLAPGDKVSFQMATMQRSGNLVARTIRLENPTAPVKYQGVINTIKDSFGVVDLTLRRKSSETGRRLVNGKGGVCE